MRREMEMWLPVWAGALFKKGGEDDMLQSSTLCFSFANVDSYNYNLIGLSLHTVTKIVLFMV